MSDAATAQALTLLDMTRRLIADAEEAASHLARREVMPADRFEAQTQLANRYRIEMTRVKAEPASLRGADQRVLEDLLAAGAQLRTLLDRRQRELAALKTISEGLAEAMAQEAARQMAPPTAYGQGGALRAGANAPAVAVNRQA